jgi:ubiquinone/menaquinone biosynthesis C-methylase UbiE
MEITSISQKRATMPSGANKVLDRRSLDNGHESLIPLLKRGMRVLDVGCGSGSITKGIAEYVGSTGTVVGVDASFDLIEQAKLNYVDYTNLSFVNQNLFQFEIGEKFDLVTSARTLQWLSNPMEALVKMKSLLKPGGQISILDYNHEKVSWSPEAPVAMKYFYSKFLAWRQDAGMNNRIADDLVGMLSSIGFKRVSVVDANELSSAEDVDFIEAAGIWSKVAETRGKQMVSDGYVTDQDRLAAIRDYSSWLEGEGQYMSLYLRSISGYNE